MGRFEGGDGVMVILVGEERWDTWYIKVGTLSYALKLKLCDCKRTLPSFEIDRHVLILIAETQRENNVLYGGRVWVTQTIAQ